ncbi:exodeoxyribonuclease VII large subunit [candidate division KSB1 bacterium]|nr:exodeoxyribonuclease VII large subunit [candidate division KSB1 bacterium]
MMELFDDQEFQVYTVSEITRDIKTTLETCLPTLWIEGEISNFVHHRSGHLYFSLKDADAQIACVVWRTRASALRFIPADGMKILALGNIRVYEKRGTYQLDCLRLVSAGVGELQLAFERLKDRLYREGLFDPQHKKPLPVFPQQIGIVTSATGAAIRDIVQVLRRRFPGIGIVLRPTLVQGEGAAADLVAAIGEFNQFGGVDVIIVGRGGGSLEDLWSFNEEIVARAIYDSKLPIVSAVGHEIDFTISDFVADLRAPTPSAAAELVVPDRREWLERLSSLRRRLLRQVEHSHLIAVQKIERIRDSYAFRQPQERLRQLEQHIDDLYDQIFRSMQRRLVGARQCLQAHRQRLQDIHPRTILQRGYCLVWHQGRQEFALSARALQPGDDVHLSFSDADTAARIGATGLPSHLSTIFPPNSGESDEKTDL